MKKYIMILLLTIFIIPFTVKAAASYDVLTLEASEKNGEISYSGTTDVGVYAVSCSLIDSDNKEVDFKSSSVDEQKFNDTFSAKEGNYTIKCANYDGGRFVTTTVKVDKVETKESTPESNPTTLDNIMLYVGILVGAVVILGAGVVIVKKKSK